MSDIQREIDGLILEIHASSLDPGRWPVVVEAARRLVGAEQAQLFALPSSLGESYWHVPINFDPATNVEYAKEFAREDVWALGGRRRGLLGVGRVSVGEEYLERREYLSSRFFNEYLVRFDIDAFLNVILPGPTEASPPTTLSFYRGLGKAAFAESQREVLRRLAPHLVLATRAFWNARAQSLHAGLLQQALGAVAVPLMIVERPGRLIYANDAAEQLLRTGDCICCSNGHLHASRAMREGKKFGVVLSEMYAGRAGTLCSTVGKEPSRTVYISAAPLMNSGEFVGDRGLGRGIIWLSPSPPGAGAIGRIAAIFCLTTAETRVLKALAEGLSLAESAESLGISIHTARSQLKAIQSKSGWRSQGQIQMMVQQFSVIST